MEFLGSLGIDVKLLIAQIINFGLLLWFLTRFLYKPIIRRIEKDENELKQTQIQKKELEQQKIALAEKEKRETTETKERTRKIIEEAEEIAQGIKEEIHKKTSEEASALIERTKGNLESLKPEIEKSVLKKARGEIGNSFRVSFLDALPLSSQKDLQDIFWGDLIERFENLTLQILKNYKQATVPKRADSPVSKEGKKKELDELLTQKIGPVVLEYVHPLTVRHSKKLEEIILKKAGVKLNIVKKQNNNLINGFRFEFAGMVIESNLLNIINDATDLKK